MSAKQVVARVKELHAQGKTWAEISADIKPLTDAATATPEATKAFKAEPEYNEYRQLRNTIIEAERNAPPAPPETGGAEDHPARRSFGRKH